MGERPGSVLAGRPLHFFVVADCSGSMNADGKMAALNTALREVIPHLRDVANHNPHAEMLVRVAAFATGARWHVETPTAVGELVWDDLTADGYSDMGAALELVAGQLEVPPMPERALPPAIVLVSDGMPTDDYASGLERLLALPWGAAAVRMGVGIGRDANLDVLRAFIGAEGPDPITASNPEQLTRLIRWASVHAGRVASTLNGANAAPVPDIDQPTSEIVW